MKTIITLLNWSAQYICAVGICYIIFLLIELLRGVEYHRTVILSPWILGTIVFILVRGLLWLNDENRPRSK